MVRWPSEAVGTGWRSAASEGHRTEPQISTRCGISPHRYTRLGGEGGGQQLSDLDPLASD